MIAVTPDNILFQIANSEIELIIIVEKRPTYNSYRIIFSTYERMCKYPCSFFSTEPSVIVNDNSNLNKMNKDELMSP